MTIGGAVEELDYCNKCRKNLEELPGNIHWSYVGEIEADKIQDFFAGQDVLVLPSLGENYCHVVFEALSSGCIPVISDRTPWNWIQEYGCGYVLPLNHEQRFTDVIEAIANMSAEEKGVISSKAVQAATLKVQQTKEHTGYRDIFG